MPKLTALHKGKSIQVEYTGTDNVMIALYDDIDWGTCGGSCACGSCICTVLEGEEFFGPSDDCRIAKRCKIPPEPRESKLIRSGPLDK